jgi:hypothetical protein
MPRGHFKTTITSVGDTIRRVAKNPNERILLTNESAENAEYMLREIKGHLTDNRVLQGLFPEIIPQDFNRTIWTRSSVLLPRPGNFREPTIDTAGVTSKIVSRHYTLIKNDDLVSDEAMFSPTVMKKTVQFVNRLVSLLVNALTDEIQVIGTRWAYHDVYSHIITKFLNYDVFVRKAIVMGKDGPEPFFPERYSMEEFQNIIENDPDQWATQYANDPRDTSVAELRANWLQYFSIGLDRKLWFLDDEGKRHERHLDDLRFYMHVDPSLGEKPSSDYTGIVVVAIDPWFNIFVIEAWHGRVDPLETTNKILELYEFYKPLMCTIEANAYQKALVLYTRQEARRRRMYVRIEPYMAPSNKRKPARILGALQPHFSTGQVWVRKGLVQFVSEYLSFGRNEHEHLLDAMAQGPDGKFWKAPIGPEASARIVRLRAERRVDRGVTGYGA